MTQDIYPLRQRLTRLCLVLKYESKHSLDVCSTRRAVSGLHSVDNIHRQFSSKRVRNECAPTSPATYSPQSSL